MMEVKDRRKYSVDDTFFDTIDSQDKAYILGLLYADGCNYEDTGIIKLDLVTEDEDVLIKIKNIMKYTGNINHYHDKYKEINGKIYECKPYSRLCIRSKQLSEQLANKGCTNNKTYTLAFPKKEIISDTLIKDFIRGYMDGDGGISYWIDNKNTGHKKFQINFCGTTDIIQSISNILSNKFKCYPAISDRYPDRDNNNLQMNICGNQVVKRILDWLYKDANIYMNRKYNKYLELLDEIKRVEEDKNLYGNAYPRRKVINLETLEIYDTVNGAGKALGVCGSAIFQRCHNHQGLMYLDEYEQIEDKNSIVINKPKLKPVQVYCIETNTTYESIVEAVRQTGVKKHTIKRQCEGFKTRNNTYHFNYVNDI